MTTTFASGNGYVLVEATPPITITTAPSLGVWGLLQDALQETQAERPADSVTSEEYAAKMGVSKVHAANLLREHKGLRAVPYRKNGRRCVCYVAAQ